VVHGMEGIGHILHPSGRVGGSIGLMDQVPENTHKTMTSSKYI